MIKLVSASKLEELKEWIAEYDEIESSIVEEVVDVLNEAKWNGMLYELNADAEIMEWIEDTIGQIDYQD